MRAKPSADSVYSRFAPIGVAFGFLAVAFVVTGVVVAVGAGATGCGPQCAGDKQGTTGCSCESDQDCATKNAVVFLCKSGQCEAGTPDAAPGAHCTADAQCGDGGACGVDHVCIAAPKCQRVDEHAAPLSFAETGAGTTGTLTATHADCTHTWSATAIGATLNVDVTIDLDGAMTVTDNGSNPACTGGTWNAGVRVGVIECTGDAWKIGPSDALAAAQCDLASGVCQ